MMADDRAEDEAPAKAVAKAAGNLDLLVEMDEPLELMLELQTIAEERMRRSHEEWRSAWAVIYNKLGEAASALKALNEPSRQR